MTETMWAYRMSGPRELERITTSRLSESDLQPGDILVEIEVGGICGSDLSYFNGGLPRRPLPVDDPTGVPVGSSWAWSERAGIPAVGSVPASSAGPPLTRDWPNWRSLRAPR